MDEIVRYMDAHWGKARDNNRTNECAECQGEIHFICSSCGETPYCGKTCQEQHWENQHRFECVGVKPGESKRERGEGEEEKEGESVEKKSHLEQPQYQEVNLSDIPADVWTRMSQFLSGQDLKNLRVSKVMEMKMRNAFFGRFRFRFTRDLFRTSTERLEELRHLITAVLIGNVDELYAFKAAKFDKIIDVKFTNDFNEKVEVDAFPTNMKYITLGDSFNQKLILPPSVTHITLGRDMRNSIGCNWGSITYFDESPKNSPHTYYNDFLINLEVFKLSHFFNKVHIGLELIRSPNLKELHFGSAFNRPLPASFSNTQIEYLKFVNFNQPLDNLPPTLRVLILGDSFNQPLPKSFKNSNIRVLIFGDAFDQSLDNLPIGLTKLVLGNDFEQPLVLPPYVDDLNINYPIMGQVIPPSVKRLVLAGIKLFISPSGGMTVGNY